MASRAHYIYRISYNSLSNLQDRSIPQKNRSVHIRMALVVGSKTRDEVSLFPHEHALLLS